MTALVPVLVVAGCARVEQASTGGFVTNPALSPGPEPTPVVPDPFSAPSPSAPPSTPSAGADPSSGPGPAASPCTDPDPAVVATCLGTTGGVAVAADSASALVTERSTGRLLRVRPGAEPVVVATLDVDGSGDGGLLDVALSPTYAEDQLLYLYLSTPTDNRVVRLAVGDSPKPVLTGIPHGAAGNAGSIAFDVDGDLLVLTGPAGTTSADPASLAGKLLRVTRDGAAAGILQGSTVVSTEIGTPGGVCTDPTTGTSWVTDRSPSSDRLRAVTATGLSRNVWTWPDHPGVAGCAAIGGRVAVSLTSGQALFVLTTSPEQVVVAKPETLADKTYGRLAGADVGPDGVVWAGTVNKDTTIAGGTPGATDDRVVRIQPSSGAGGASPA